MQAAVEVLVVSYGSHAVVDRLLRSVADRLPGAAVAIREHSGTTDLDALERVVTSFPGPVRVQHDPSNPGFGAGCNALAAGSSADFLVFLNPDAELVEWPWSVSEPPRGTVVGALMVDSGAPGEHYGPRYRVRDEIARSWLRRQPPPPAGAGYVSGAAMLIERASFDRIGGFDEGFFLFYEDIDLCVRANAAGIGTVIEPRWKVRHSRHHSTESRFAQALEWSYESARRYHAKLGSSTRGYALYVVTDSALRALWHRCAGRRNTARAYLTLANRALGDLFRYRRPAV